MTIALAWTATAAAVIAVERATSAQTPLTRMFALVGVLFVGMKVVVAVTWMQTTGGRLSLARWAAFGLWAGMRPADFVVRHDPPRPLDARPAGGALAGGALLLVLARALVGHAHLAALVLALPALSLILHFGILRLLAAFWRARGFDVAAPFDAPLTATSLAEFWSRRWNRAFSEMTALCIHRPVTRARGAAAGLMASFFFSGVVHELAVSVPVRAGFGGPLTYFLVHGVLVALERRAPAARRRLRTAAAVLLPLPLLFHRPFLEGVVLPMLR